MTVWDIRKDWPVYTIIMNRHVQLQQKAMQEFIIRLQHFVLQRDRAVQMQWPVLSEAFWIRFRCLLFPVRCVLTRQPEVRDLRSAPWATRNLILQSQRQRWQNMPKWWQIRSVSVTVLKRHIILQRQADRVRAGLIFRWIFREAISKRKNWKGLTRQNMKRSRHRQFPMKQLTLFSIKSAVQSVRYFMRETVSAFPVDMKISAKLWNCLAFR